MGSLCPASSFSQVNRKLDIGFYSIIGYSDLANYKKIKHNLTEPKLQKVHVIALANYLANIQAHHRATLSKLIHGWIPTYSSLCRQGKEPSPLCPRCKSRVESWEHILECPNHQAVESRRDALKTFLSSMFKVGTPFYILTTFELKLSNYQNPYPSNLNRITQF
jgi:hypothetical protein